MMNRYFKNLNKIEFVVTYACTGRCKHCSEGEHKSCGERIDPQIAADAVRKIAAEYDIKTVMTFGGEPLLYPEAVYEIMSVAKELNIPKRQIITNGYFTKINSPFGWKTPPCVLFTRRDRRPRLSVSTGLAYIKIKI